MAKKERKEEKELINQIKNYKRQLRDSLKENFLREREARHKKGEAFFKGFWVPQDKIEKIHKLLLRRGRVIFFEIHLLVLAVVFLNFFLWRLFKQFFLP